MKKLFLFVLLIPNFLFGQTMRQVASAGTTITRLPSALTTTTTSTDTVMIFKNGQWVKAPLSALNVGISSISVTSPILSTGGATPTISITNSSADGSTKGAASFTANDFNSSSGNISIDYTNGQAASGSTKGFLTSTDWNTFNNKWGILGNSGTNSGTNFLGTSDDVALRFRVNNTAAGTIDHNSGITVIGYGNGGSFSSATDVTGFGAYTALSVTSGINISLFGSGAGRNISTKSNSTAVGYFAFGNNNIAGGVALGNKAGLYEDEDDRFYIDAIDRTNKSNGRTLSMLYGVFGSAISTQSLTINAQVKINDGSGSTGYVFTKKADGFGDWEAPYNDWTKVGNDIRNNNSAGVAIGPGIAFPLTSQVFINSTTVGKTALEIAPTNGLGLSVLDGGADIYNTYTSRFGAKIFSAGDGLIVQSDGTGLNLSSPGLVSRTQNIGTLSANSTDVGISFQDDQILNGKTSTGNFFQLTCSNASTRNPFTIINNGTNLFSFTYTGRLGIGTGTTTPTARIHLAAGTTSASSGPIKLTEGSNPTTPEDGLINYVNNNVTFTETSTVYTLAKVLNGSATLDFPSTGPGAYNELTITVTGASVGDPVSLGTISAPGSANTMLWAYVSASNTVTVRLNNADASSTVDLASATYKVSVIKQ